VTEHSRVSITLLHPEANRSAIEVVNHELEDLKTLALKTKVLISTVGPYWRYGTPVVQACAEVGTHYLDV
jgi:short subunit dehydrogenase-like uncharacterized protein